MKIAAALALTSSLLLASAAAVVVDASPSTTAVSHGVVLVAQPVYTLQPLNFNLFDALTPALQGKVCNQGQCVSVDYPASLGDWSIQAGADNLDTTLVNSSGSSTVFAYSEGAQSVTRWLVAHGKQRAMQGRVNFVLIGNPERVGGFRDRNGFTDPSTPTNLGYQIVDIAREYDGWADWPTRQTPLAVLNAFVGQLTVHDDYNDVDAPTTLAEAEQALTADPNAETNLIWKSGDTVYVVNRTELVPLVRPLALIGLSRLAESINDVIKPQIDAAYDRPAQGTGFDVDATASANAVAKSQRTTVAAAALRPVTAARSQTTNRPALSAPDNVFRTPSNRAQPGHDSEPSTTQSPLRASTRHVAARSPGSVGTPGNSASSAGAAGTSSSDSD